jgi:hypothetical protein
MTGGQVHNVNMLDELRLEAGALTCSIAVRSVNQRHWQTFQPWLELLHAVEQRQTQ